MRFSAIFRRRATATLALSSLFFSAAVVFPQSAQARECNIGTTVFTDSLYGMMGGAAVGGLWMLANMDDTDSSDIVPNLATAALIGTGVGAVLGIVEVGLCTREVAEAPKPGMQMPGLVTMQMERPTHAVRGMGVGFTYLLR